MTKLKSIIVWEVVCFLAAALGALASGDAPAFYAQLVRPVWAPTAAVFGVVWPLLYALMGLAAGLLWHERKSRKVFWPIVFFCAQLLLNTVWTWLFFDMRNATAALADALLLFVVLAVTIVLFAGRHVVAAVLLLPYLAWIAFACALTHAVWRLNPGLV